MRKRVIPAGTSAGRPDGRWLPLEELAEVEITSEDAAYPIEGALSGEGGPGWRAASPGKQTVRLLFERPQRVERIWLSFVESEVARTQEYVVRWSGDGGRTFHDVVRQQWNFSPLGSTAEIEDHRVELPAVTVLELTVVPHTGGAPAIASLERLRLA